jgi:hypothetical protein
MGEYDARKTVKSGQEGQDKIFSNFRERVARTNAEFDVIEAAREMRAIEDARVSGTLRPVQAGDKRETALIKGVMAVARYYGDVLKPICGIDGHGELSLASQPAKPFDMAGVPFSAEFCEALNIHTQPRCGMFPGAVMEPQNSNWCWIHHFDGERMVYAIAERLEKANKIA